MPTPSRLLHAARLAALLLLPTAACGGGSEAPRAAAPGAPAGGAAPFSFELNGRRITADWISATWSVGGTPEIVNVTAHFDGKRYPKLPPTMAVQIYNFRSAAQPLVSQREASPFRSTKPVYSLAFSDHKDRVGPVSEESFVDVYPGATSTLTITQFDTVGLRISGTFSGTLVNEKGGTVSVTNGRFDRVALEKVDYSGK